MSREYYRPENYYKNVVENNDICGDTIESLTEWYHCPYKYNIMNEVTKFKDKLRENTRQSKIAKILGVWTPHQDLGMRYHGINTPIVCIKDMSVLDIQELIDIIEKGVHGGNNYVNKSLVNTELGEQIVKDLRKCTFSDHVYCHNALCYKNFVIKDNSLIGIKNWEYSGYYPPEFEDVVQKYLEFFEF